MCGGAKPKFPLLKMATPTLRWEVGVAILGLRRLRGRSPSKAQVGNPRSGALGLRATPSTQGYADEVPAGWGGAGTSSTEPSRTSSPANSPVLRWPTLSAGTSSWMGEEGVEEVVPRSPKHEVDGVSANPSVLEWTTKWAIQGRLRQPSHSRAPPSNSVEDYKVL